MIFKYGLKQFKRRPFSSVLIIFLFAAIILLIDFVLIGMGNYFVGSKLIKNVVGDNFYYLSYSSDASEYFYEHSPAPSIKMMEQIDKYKEKLERKEITQDECKQLIKQYMDEALKRDKKFGRDLNAHSDSDPYVANLPYVENKYIYASFVLCGDIGGDSHTCALNHDYINSLDFKMKKGSWLSKAEKEDGYVNLVATSDSGYKVRDTVELYDFDHYLCMITDDDDEDMKEEIAKGRIVGLIDYSYYKPMMEDSSLIMGTERFNFNGIFHGFDEDTIFMEYTDELLNRVNEINDDFENFEDYSKIVRLKDNITDSEFSEFMRVASENHITVTKMESLYNNTYMKEMKEFKNDIIYISLSFLIAVIALIGISAINISRETKTYSIYCINGMTKRQCIGINAAYLTILIGFSSIIALLVKMWLAFKEYFEAAERVERLLNEGFDVEKAKYFDYFNIGTNEAVTVCALLIAALLSAMVIPYVTLKKLDIVKKLKESE